MGRDKAALPFGGESLLDRVLRLVRTQTDDVVVAAGAAQEVTSGIEVVRDETPGLGPLPALVLAFGRVRHPRAFVVACDTPLLQPAIIPTLLDYSTGWEACVPVIGGVQMAACAVYATAATTRAAGAFRSGRGAGLRDLIARLRTRFVPADELREADPDLLSFTPCNTPEEYRHALTLAGLAD